MCTIVSLNSAKIVLLVVLIIMSVSFLSACRMMALIGLNGNNLSTPNNGFMVYCLNQLESQSLDNDNGWGLVLYDYTDPSPNIQPSNVFRGSLPAHLDPDYDTAIGIIDTLRTPRILLGHVRSASDGDDDIDNPNPFNPSTSISFVLSKEAEATVQIYNIKGQKVFDFGAKHYPAGKTTLDWNGRDKSNGPVSSGIYFVRIKTNDDSHIHKMIMMK